MVTTATATHGCRGRAHLRACHSLVVSTTHRLADAAGLDVAAVDAAEAERKAVASVGIEGVPLHPLCETPCQGPGSNVRCIL